jgi:hypothetical protein
MGNKPGALSDVNPFVNHTEWTNLYICIDLCFWVNNCGPMYFTFHLFSAPRQ